MDAAQVLAIIVPTISAVASAVVAVYSAKHRLSRENRKLIIEIAREEADAREERLSKEFILLRNDLDNMRDTLIPCVASRGSHFELSEELWRDTDREILHIRLQTGASRMTVYSLGNGSRFLSGESEQVYSVKCENHPLNASVRRKSTEQRVSVGGEIYDMIELSGKGLIKIEDLGDEFYSIKAYVNPTKAKAVVADVVKFGSLPCALLLLEFSDLGKVEQWQLDMAVMRVDELKSRMQATVVDRGVLVSNNTEHKEHGKCDGTVQG